LASFASGAVLGSIAIVAIHVSYAKPENASAPGLGEPKTGLLVAVQVALARGKKKPPAT
jgi:hypothetical protein